MKGYVRSLNYWCYNMERLFLVMAATIVILSLFQAGDRDQIFRWILSYLPMLGAVCLISSGHNTASYQVPLALSYGSTRKEIFFGEAIMTHILMLQFLLLAVLFHTFIPKEYFTNDYIRTCALIFLVFGSIGSGLGAGVLRFGNRAVTIVYLIMIFLVSISMGVLITLDADLNALISFFHSAAMLGIVILFDLLMLGVYWLALKNYEVRS